MNKAFMRTVCQRTAWWLFCFGIALAPTWLNAAEPRVQKGAPLGVSFLGDASKPSIHVVPPGEIWEIVALEGPGQDSEARLVIENVFWIHGNKFHPIVLVPGQGFHTQRDSSGGSFTRVAVNQFVAEPSVSLAAYRSIEEQLGSVRTNLNELQDQWFRQYGTNLQSIVTNLSIAAVAAALDARQRHQAEEITRLRDDVADLRRINADLLKRLDPPGEDKVRP